MEAIVSEPWLMTLQTENPQTGWDLAMKLARMSIKVTQPSAEVRTQLRTAYDHDSAQLIATSQVVATNFQTVAAANNWWR
jgi:hypothetical protein